MSLFACIVADCSQIYMLEYIVIDKVCIKFGYINVFKVTDWLSGQYLVFYEDVSAQLPACTHGSGGHASLCSTQLRDSTE